MENVDIELTDEENGFKSSHFNKMLPEDISYTYEATSKYSILPSKSGNTTFDEGNDFEFNNDENPIAAQGDANRSTASTSSIARLGRFRYFEGDEVGNDTGSIKTCNQNQNKHANKKRIIVGPDDLLEPEYSVKLEKETQDEISEKLPEKLPGMATVVSDNCEKSPCLIETTILPPNYRSAFNFSSFNKMQSECFPDLFGSTSNCVISAPTGSGKTVLFELAIIRLFKDNQNQKAVYLAPTKALCNERYKDWKTKFAMMNLSVVLLTGDDSNDGIHILKVSDLVITTPEKWDCITKSCFGSFNLLNQYKLLLVDEIHFLADSRGATLEIVISRMKSHSGNIRIIALSATVANIEDISSWLKLNSSSVDPARALSFDDTYRSVSLQKVVLGFKSYGTNNFKFDYNLNAQLIEVLNNFSCGKATLIFCPTRNSCVSTAKYLNVNMSKRSAKPVTHCIGLLDKDLIGLSKNGIAYHHAGLSYGDRHRIETAFIDGEISSLCCTSTLAVGVNLPAYLVVIKGTKCWINTGFEEYNETDILQMIGRAGRPDYETFGKAVIMTELGNKQKYEKLVSGTDSIESSLYVKLREHLVAEVNLESVRTSAEALDWIKSTFLYQRCLKNWEKYAPSFGKVDGALDIDSILVRHVDAVLGNLKTENIVQLNQLDQYCCTIYGNMMSKYFMRLDTMKMIMQLSKDQSLQNILVLLSEADEFSYLKMKFHEKKLFREINKSLLIKFPCTEKDIGVHGKVFLLVQFELGGVEFPAFDGCQKLLPNFHSDKSNVLKASSRILRCLIDVFLHNKDAVSLISTFKLFRCITGRCWDGSPMVLRQLEGIGVAYMKKLTKNNITNLHSIKSINIQQLEYYLNIKTGNSSKIYKGIRSIPDFQLSLNFLSKSISEKNGSIRFRFNVGVTVSNAKAARNWRNRTSVLCVISYLSDGTLVDFRRIPISRFIDESKKTFIIGSTITNLDQTIITNAYAENIVGIESSMKISLQELVDEAIILKRLPRMIQNDDNCEIEFDSFNSSNEVIITDGNKSTLDKPLSEDAATNIDESDLNLIKSFNKRKFTAGDKIFNPSFIPKKIKSKRIKFHRIDRPAFYDNSSGDEYFKSLMQE